MSTAMQTMFLIYDEAMDREVRKIIEQEMAVIPRYTRIDGVIGARLAEQEARTGYLDDRRNRMIVAVAEAPVMEEMLEELRKLRERKGHGLRAFVVPLVAVI